ncbi:MAG: class I SAM-dependent methyltransferase [Rhizobacter sp.]|nr:class I SAM-dependent methyltransferase [Bacteriovorax sp.]
MEKKIFFSVVHKYPLVVAVITQLFVLFTLRNVLLLILQLSVSIWTFVFLQGLICAMICYFFLKLPKWFIVISFLFPIFFSVAWNYLHISAGIYGLIFILLALTFSHTLKERVPLYLSNSTTVDGLKKIIDEQKAKKVIDLGSGTGGVVRGLSSETIISHGVESAPMLWIFSALCSWLSRKGSIYRKNIWDTNFSDYDVVYAFLSPAIMEKLFQKIKNEMKPGTVFISNSFQVPNTKASEVRTLDDGRKTKLFIYRR